MNIRELGYRGYDGFFGGRVFRNLSEVSNLHEQPEAMDVFVRDKLERLLRCATASVKFYAERSDGGANLEQYPVVSRACIQKNYDDFLARGFGSADRIKSYTSGTYASPLVIVSHRDKVARRRAEVIFLNQMLGYYLGMRFVYLRATAKSKNDTMPEIHKLSQNEVNADITDVTREELMRVNARLRRGDIEFIVAWPSVLKLLAEDHIAQGEFPRVFRSIVTTGEALYEPDRELIERVYGCRVYDRYGCTEVGIIAYEGPERGRLRVNRTSIVVEVLRFTSDEPAALGEAGRIVVTDLYSDAMPLIRYDTGDVGVAAETAGRQVLSLTSVDGRYMEKFTDTLGRYVVPMMLIHCLPESEKVKLAQYQFVQEGPGAYAFRAVVKTDMLEEDKILGNMRDVLGAAASIRFEYAKGIPNLASGKYGIMINEWNRAAARCQ